ncbi:MAG: transglutaminase family protein [Spirochaetia bacterium]|nr:transglutaminase family protein [Spirochaetia bacterium]
MVRYRIIHRTTYQYAEEVSLCHNEAQMTPRATEFQSVRDSRIVVSPQPNVSMERSDYFGNRSYYFAVQSPHNVLEILSESTVELSPRTGPSGNNPILPNSATWEEVRDRLRGPEFWNIYEYITDSSHARSSRALREYAEVSFTPGRPILLAVWDFTQRIHTDFKYEPGSTSVATRSEEVLKMRRGVCQDFTHLAISCMRSLGLAARYVSGYIESAPTAGPRLQGADASHAWFAAFVPGLGWFDFDPTNRNMPADQHITVSYGRDYADITPVKGIVFGGGKSVCKVAVDVLRSEANPGRS